MPKAFQYKTGALIYIQGDFAEKAYILQNGKISLVYQDIESGDDIRDQVMPGEFFGVKSALGRFPREENAIALTDSTILAFSVSEFESLIMANTRIIMKMLTVFSNHMRRVHTQISSLMEKEDAKPDEGLFNVGEYYLKNKRYAQAKYVFSRYLTYYPSGRNAAQAAKNLEAAEAGIAQQGKAPAPAAAVADTAAKSTAGSAEGEKEPSVMRDYYDAASLISKEQYRQAYQAFKKIVDAEGDSEWGIKSSFEMGRCLFLLNQFGECISFYTAMLIKYPRHPEIRQTLYYIGQSNEKIGKKEQAAAFYRKLLLMPGGDTDGITMKTKQALEQAGG